MRIRVLRAALLLVVLTAGCAGTSQAQREDVPQPEIRIGQLPGSGFVIQYRGPLSIGYVVQITNTLSEPIQLKSVRLRTVGTSPYRLDGNTIPVRKEIQPGATERVEISAPGFSFGGRLAASQPLTIRGVAHFDSPTGQFQTVFTEQIFQPDDTVLE
jgi:hypothetical protein